MQVIAVGTGRIQAYRPLRNTVLPDGPADRGGVRVGDQMLEINSENVASISLADLLSVFKNGK